jgi:hypothetical protein
MIFGAILGAITFLWLTSDSLENNPSVKQMCIELVVEEIYTPPEVVEKYPICWNSIVSYILEENNG